MSSNIVVEIVEFRLVDGTADDLLIREVDTLETEFHMRQPGYIDSELAKCHDSVWVMIMHWRSMEELKQAIKLMMSEPITEPFRRLIDGNTVKMRLLDHIHSWRIGR